MLDSVLKVCDKQGGWGRGRAVSVAQNAEREALLLACKEETAANA